MVEDFLWTCGDAASEIEIVGDFNARFVVEKQLFVSLSSYQNVCSCFRKCLDSNSWKTLEKNMCLTKGSSQLDYEFKDAGRTL